MVRVLGLGGSLASTSASLAALRVALEGAREAGAEVELLDLRTLDLPFYSPEIEAPPAAARRLADSTYEADGLIWASPLYHGTMSGAFKNALDWLQLLADRKPAFLTDKVVGLLSTAGGVQGLQAINTMEFVVRALRGWAVPLVVPIARADAAFDDDAQPVDPKLEAQLRVLGAEVVHGARHFASGHAVEARS